MPFNPCVIGRTLDLRRMQRVQLVLVGALLSADALGAFEPHGQIARRLGVIGREVRPLTLALHLAHDDAQNRALALDHFLQAPELLGMRVATMLALLRYGSGMPFYRLEGLHRWWIQDPAFSGSQPRFMLQSVHYRRVQISGAASYNRG